MKILNKIIEQDQKTLNRKIEDLYIMYSKKRIKTMFNTSYYLDHLLDLNTEFNIKSMFVQAKCKFFEQIKLIMQLKSSIKDLNYELLNSQANV